MKKGRNTARSVIKQITTPQIAINKQINQTNTKGSKLKYSIQTK